LPTQKTERDSSAVHGGDSGGHPPPTHPTAPAKSLERREKFRAAKNICCVAFV